MIGIIFSIIFLYLLARLIFGFVIPVVSTYLKMKKKMKSMSDQYSAQSHQEKNSQSNNFPKTSKASRSDYIDFEEIK